MTAGADHFAPGSIWWTLTTFGGELDEEAKKYFVILAEPTAGGTVGWVAKCTSKERRYPAQTASPCGLPTNACYRIEAGEEDCFPRTTFVQYDKIKDVTFAQLVDGVKQGKAAFIKQMDPGRFRSLLACAKKSKDPTGRSLHIIGRDQVM